MLTKLQKKKIIKKYKSKNEFSKGEQWVFNQKARALIKLYYHNCYIPFEMSKISQQFDNLRYNYFDSNKNELKVYSFFMSLVKEKFELDEYKLYLNNAYKYLDEVESEYGIDRQYNEELCSLDYFIDKIKPIIAKKEYEKLSAAVVKNPIIKTKRLKV